MANLLSRITRRESRDITSIDDYISTVGALGYSNFEQTLVDGRIKVGHGFSAHAALLLSNSVVFTCMQIRQEVFSAARFSYQRLRDSRPSDLFGSRDLRILERPWVGGTTQDLLTRTIQDADLAGNSFWTRLGGEVVRLRPDWVDIAVEPRVLPKGGQVGWRKLGYIYYEGGRMGGKDGVAFLVDEVAHFMPRPDPLNEFRGMSWLTPVIREIEADLTMTRHKRRFFENGATPNMIIKHPAGADREKIADFAKRLDANNAGTSNAYKNLHLYPGADATVVGADLRSIDFKAVQGAGETRIASAAGVPVVIAGLSEGLQGSSLNEGNYGQARRRFADGTMHPLWQNVAGSFEPIMPDFGPDSRLWYDAQDIPFLREDEGDAADIQKVRAETISNLITSGYDPTSVVAAVDGNDFRLLRHTGLYSVQLRQPGTDDPAPAPTKGDAP